ncbi:MAG: hypothetical protein AAGA02_02535, partial [Bacteroidota bacterium]
MNYKNLLSFYRDCFESDTRTFSLTNVFSTKFENRFFLEGKDELLNAHLPRIPLNKEIAEPILENLSIYSHEKSLYLSCFLASGKTAGNGGNKQTICAPIFFYPAQIKQDKAHYYLSIKRELAFANTTFLEAYRK